MVDLAYTELQRAVMPVMGWVGEQLVPLGTCFAITSTGVLLTARHVVDQFLVQHDEEIRSRDAGLFAVHETDVELPMRSDSYFGGPLKVVSAMNHPLTDICALKIEIPRVQDDARFPIAIGMDVGLPSVDEPVVAIGYPHMRTQGRVPRQGPGVSPYNPVDYERTLAVSNGQIEEVHPEKRDLLHMPFPSARTNLRFDHGMSGGPVIGSGGHVIGIVCSAFDPDSSNPERWTSYISLLGPALDLAVLQAPGPNGEARFTTIYDFAQSGAVQIDGWDDLDIDDEGNEVRVRYKQGSK